MCEYHAFGLRILFGTTSNREGHVSPRLLAHALRTTWQWSELPEVTSQPMFMCLGNA